MADIFISYSRKDSIPASRIAAFLEAAGYSVWWDNELLSGKNFRKAIMEELQRARVVLVLWSGNSIESDWVQSEAARAHSEKKLIAAKTSEISYKDIPPPFDNMHVESWYENEKILAAVKNVLAQPTTKTSPFILVFRRWRLEAFSWFGVIGAVITLTTNLRGVITLTSWARDIVTSWVSILTYFWGMILFFIPKIYPGDALFLTIIAFSTVTLVSCVDIKRDYERDYSRSYPIIPAIIILGIFVVGFLGIAAEKEEPEIGLYVTGAKRILEIILVLLDTGFGPSAAVILFFPAAIIALLVYPFTVVGILFAIFSFVKALIMKFSGRATTLFFDLNAERLSIRLWRIVISIAFLVFLNYLSIWLEQQDWVSRLLT